MRAVALAAVLLVTVVHVHALSLEKVHLVDYNIANGNMLFRGDMPCNKTAFDYSNLVSYMKQRASESGVPFPSPFYLIDISLNSFDENILEVEFWTNPANAGLGKMVFWPIGFAGIFPPSFYPLAEAEQMAQDSVWAWDDLPVRIPQARAMFETTSSLPQIIYVHCTAGCDRTGEFIGSYRMMYQGLIANTTHMYALDCTECGRPPNWFGTNGLEWWCFYQSLQVNNTANLVNCDNFATCELFGNCTPTHPSEDEVDEESDEAAPSSPVTVNGRAQPTRALTTQLLQRVAKALQIPFPFKESDFPAGLTSDDAVASLALLLREKLQAMQLTD